MPIVRKIDKQARALARAALGPLAIAMMNPARRNRNLRAAAIFLVWCIQEKFPIDYSNDTLIHYLTLNASHLWQSGDGKDASADTLFGVKLTVGGKHLDLSQPWQLFKKWSSLELPAQAPPLLKLELLALAGLAFEQGRWGLGAALLAGFDSFLRPGEFMGIAPQHLTFTDTAVVIYLGLTKGVKRRGGHEEVVIRDELLCRLFRRLYYAVPPGMPFSMMDPRQGRAWLLRSLRALNLQHRKIQLYSVRRGGLTQAFIDGASLSSLCLRARWQDPKLAKVYITEGRQLVQTASLSPAQLETLNAAAATAAAALAQI